MSVARLFRPLMKKFRAKRLGRLVALFPELENYTVLDVGGTPMMWDLLEKRYGVRPKTLVILNLESALVKTDKYEMVAGNACDLQYGDDEFDLVFSNSVIEHVGLENIQSFASECRRVGKYHFIQTPNKWFPLELHLIAPLIHWLPRKIYRLLAPISLLRFSLWNNSAEFYRIVDGTNLLDWKQMKLLFPESEIEAEIVLGMTKSIMVHNQPVTNTSPV